MSLTELAVRIRKPFEGGEPVAPSDQVKTILGSLWGNGLWILAAVAAFALLGALFMFFKYRSNGNNDGAERAGWIIGACIASGFILGIVGTVTGT